MRLLERVARSPNKRPGFPPGTPIKGTVLARILTLDVIILRRSADPKDADLPLSLAYHEVELHPAVKLAFDHRAHPIRKLALIAIPTWEIMLRIDSQYRPSAHDRRMAVRASQFLGSVPIKLCHTDYHRSAFGIKHAADGLRDIEDLFVRRPCRRFASNPMVHIREGRRFEFQVVPLWLK